VAFIVQLSESRRKWKRLAVSGVAKGQPSSTSSSAATAFQYAIMVVLGFFITFNLGKAFGTKQKNNSKHSSSKKHSSLVMVFGKYEMDIPTFCAVLSTSMVLVGALGAQIGLKFRRWRESQSENDKDIIERVPDSRKENSIDVVIVGCGPKSVGWFHLMQFLDMQHVFVRAVVEPFYLDERKCPYPPQSFVDLVVMLDEMGIKCVTHVGQLEMFRQPTLCVISGRTHDNPGFYQECIGKCASHIYLETPGAPTIAQLRDMQSLAATSGVEVYMGYQRLCASYINKAVSLSRSVPKSHVFFAHNENYPREELSLVVGRRPEGMIRSMAAQELAVLVTQFGVKADEIDAFKVNTKRVFSERQTFYNTESGIKLTDFSRVAFKITTKNRRSTSVLADRCGGLVNFAVVKSHTGKELQRFQSHDESQVLMLQSDLREDKDISHQFIVESDEFLELKKRVVRSILGGDARMYLGLASIQDGIDVMALADYCTEKINAVLTTED
jgi:predicted dehydrogenase